MRRDQAIAWSGVRGFSLLLTSLLVCFAPFEAVLAKRAPNIVLIVADDLGVGDIGRYGGRAVATPHIDSIGDQRERKLAKPLWPSERNHVVEIDGVKVELHN